MSWNIWVRQIHRWLSILFTVTVIANFIAMAQGQPPGWVVYSPLPPLGLLLFTGLYLFVLPHASKWRSGRARSRGGRVLLAPTVRGDDLDDRSPSRSRPIYHRAHRGR